ncbi:hypothetical protein E8E11_004567, partial [Didymella keratinophila]
MKSAFRGASSAWSLVLFERSTPRISAPDTSFATVIVGRQKKRFVVHEAVLIHHSEYFRAALTGGFTEAQDKTVTIEDTTVETFEFFVHWLYYQRFPDKEQHDDPELVNSFYNDGQPRSTKLVKLYIFADVREVPALRKAVIGMIFAMVEDPNGEIMSVPTIEDAFEQRPVEDPLCRLLVDQQCCYEALICPQRAEFTNPIYIKPQYSGSLYTGSTHWGTRA